MTKASDNAYPSVLVAEQGSTPTSPSAGNQRLFVKTSDHLLYFVNSSGTVTAVGSGGGGIAVTGCKAYHSTTQSCTGGATTTLAFDSEEFDGATYHDTSSNNSRLTVPATGLYHVGASSGNVAGTSNEFEMWFRKNGTTDLRGGILLIGNVDGNQGHHSTIVSLTAADYLEVRLFVKTTGNVGSATASLASEFWIYRLT